MKRANEQDKKCENSTHSDVCMGGCLNPDRFVYLVGDLVEIINEHHAFFGSKGEVTKCFYQGNDKVYSVHVTRLGGQADATLKMWEDSLLLIERDYPEQEQVCCQNTSKACSTHGPCKAWSTPDKDPVEIDEPDEPTEILDRKPVVASTWRHYKGDEYYVICTGWIEANTTPCVIYEPVGGGTIWVRPTDNFLAPVGNDSWRFVRVS